MAKEDLKHTYVCSEECTVVLHTLLMRMEVKAQQTSASRESYRRWTARVEEWGAVANKVSEVSKATTCTTLKLKPQFSPSIAYLKLTELSLPVAASISVAADDWQA